MDETKHMGNSQSRITGFLKDWGGPQDSLWSLCTHCHPKLETYMTQLWYPDHLLSGQAMNYTANGNTQKGQDKRQILTHILNYHQNY